MDEAMCLAMCWAVVGATEFWSPSISCLLPSGKLSHNYGKSPFLMGKSAISMAMFNSYVKLPEGNGKHMGKKQ
jgi:hypothetical protein